MNNHEEVKKLETKLLSCGDSDSYKIIRELVELNIPEAFEPLMKALPLSNHHKRCWLTTALGDLAFNLDSAKAKEKVIPILIKSMKDDKYFAVRQICSEQLSRLNCIDAINPIIEVIEETFSYDMIPSDHELSHLKDGWPNEHYNMRRGAINALEKIGLKNKELIGEIKAIIENLKIAATDEYYLKNHLNGAIRKLEESTKPKRIYESFIDPRDGKKYKIIKIGAQVWMAENLAYKEHSDGWPYNDKEENVKKYGYLYDWESAMRVCPDGWHLPTDEEWKELEIHLGMSPSDADKINEATKEVKRGTNEGSKLKSTEDWYEGEQGTNESGFSALPAEGKDSFGDYRRIIDKSYTQFWSSSEIEEDKEFMESSRDVWIRELRGYKDTITRERAFKNGWCSIRCIKGAIEKSDKDTTNKTNKAATEKLDGE